MTSERGTRRSLQLALAGLWLLDAVLQVQQVMYTRAFSASLAATGPGNPAVIAAPIAWSAGLISQHPAMADTGFAIIQLLLGLGIAWRPTVRLALAASVAWSLTVWWLGEGLGGLVNGTASPVTGAPGAVLLYALIAVLLWPRRPGQRRPGQRPGFPAAAATGGAAARLLWLLLWAGLAGLALAPATAAPGRLGGLAAGMARSEPAWLSAADRHLAAVLTADSPATAAGLAAVLALIAAGVFLPDRAVRAVLVLAIVTAAAFWVAQGLGGLLTGSSTDPGSAPLLALLALCYWPSRPGSDNGGGQPATTAAVPALASRS